MPLPRKSWMPKARPAPETMKALHATLILAAIAVTQLFFGGGDGTRLIYILPGYLVLGFSGVLALLSFWKAPARMDRSCLAASVVLGIYLFARIALSPSAWLARFDLFAVLAALLVYFLTALHVSGIGQRVAIVCGLLVLGVGQAAIGMYQFGRDASFNPLLSENRAEMGARASGLFISPNHLAGFLETALLLATSLCFWGGFKARGRILLGYLALVCLAGLVLTGSRGGYLSAAAGFAVFAFLSVWTMRSRLSHGLLPRAVAIVAAVALIGGGIVWAAERSFAIRARANTVFVSWDMRFWLWEAAWEQFKVAPAFGTGSRTYVIYGRTFRAPGVQDDPVFAHSDWLQTLAEYGIAGMLLIAGFVVAHLRHGWRRWHRMVERFSTAMGNPAESRALALQMGTLSAIAAILVHAVIDFNLHIPANMLLAAFLFGVLATRRTRADEAKASWPARTLHAIPAGLGIWMLAAGGPRVPGELFVETARGKFASGKFGPALEDAGQALARGVQNPELHFQIGEVRRLASYRFQSSEATRWALEDAHESYADALAIFPQDVGIVLRDVWALDRLGRLDEAEQLLARAKELDPNSVKVLIRSAQHWKLRDKPAEALAEFRKAALCPLTPMILTELHEEFDPKELEKLLPAEKTGDSK